MIIAGSASNTYFDVIFSTDFLHVDIGYYAEFVIRDEPGKLLNSVNTTLSANIDCEELHCEEYCYHGYEEDGAGCPTCRCVVGETGRQWE
jgi:hypothetical protein